MTPPDTSTDEKETETPKKTEAKVTSGDNTVVPPCGKESPKSSEQDVSVDSSDGDVSSSVSPQQSDVQSKVAADPQESAVSSRQGQSCTVGQWL